jgi:hypothetical protein
MNEKKLKKGLNKPNLKCQDDQEEFCGLEKKMQHRIGKR